MPKTLRFDLFNRFDRTPIFDRETDRQTGTISTVVASTALSQQRYAAFLFLHLLLLLYYPHLFF